MENSFDSLSEVMPGRESWRFKVRFHRGLVAVFIVGFMLIEFLGSFCDGEISFECDGEIS
jgi:hypothetical protein